VQVNGRTIRTTAEHPFYVWDKGWTAAHALQAGDRLRSDDGQMVVVKAVCDSGVMETVYNCRVADYHTYFVGDADWGFSVWAHNKCYVVDMEPGIGMKRTSGPLTSRQAIQLARDGENIGATSIREARDVAQAVSPIGQVEHDAAKWLKNGVWQPGHFHPLDANGARMGIYIYYS
jgi:hypothetical protein